MFEPVLFHYWRMVLNGILSAFAAEVAALLVLCGEKMERLTPASRNTFLTHLPMVSTETALCGFIIETNNLLPTRRGAVLSKYSLSTVTKHYRLSGA